MRLKHGGFGAGPYHPTGLASAHIKGGESERGVSRGPQLLSGSARARHYRRHKRRGAGRLETEDSTNKRVLGVIEARRRALVLRRPELRTSWSEALGGEPCTVVIIGSEAFRKALQSAFGFKARVLRRQVRKRRRLESYSSSRPPKAARRLKARWRTTDYDEALARAWPNCRIRG